MWPLPFRQITEHVTKKHSRTKAKPTPTRARFASSNLVTCSNCIRWDPLCFTMRSEAKDWLQHHVTRSRMTWSAYGAWRRWPRPAEWGPRQIFTILPRFLRYRPETIAIDRKSRLFRRGDEAEVRLSQVSAVIEVLLRGKRRYQRFGALEWPADRAFWLAEEQAPLFPDWGAAAHFKATLARSGVGGTLASRRRQLDDASSDSAKNKFCCSLSFWPRVCATRLRCRQVRFVPRFQSF